MDGSNLWALKLNLKNFFYYSAWVKFSVNHQYIDISISIFDLLLSRSHHQMTQTLGQYTLSKPNVRNGLLMTLIIGFESRYQSQNHRSNTSLIPTIRMTSVVSCFTNQNRQTLPLTLHLCHYHDQSQYQVENRGADLLASHSVEYLWIFVSCTK